MRKISSIKITNNYVLLILDDKTRFRISEDDYFDYKFKAKMEIDDILFEKLKTMSNYHEAYMSALNKIKYKDRTEYEIRSHMYDDFNLIKPDVDKIIEKLKRYDFINDERYVRDFIERAHAKYHGYNKIKSELIDVRINSTYLENHLNYVFKDEYKRAYRYAENSLRTIRNKNKLQTENSLRQKLLYRGYAHEVISAVIEDLNIDVDDDLEQELLLKEFEKVMRRYEKKYSGYDLRVRIFNYLASRGYGYADINDLLDGRLKVNE